MNIEKVKIVKLKTVYEKNQNLKLIITMIIVYLKII